MPAVLIPLSSRTKGRKEEDGCPRPVVEEADDAELDEGRDLDVALFLLRRGACGPGGWAGIDAPSEQGRSRHEDDARGADDPERGPPVEVGEGRGGYHERGDHLAHVAGEVDGPDRRRPRSTVVRPGHHIGCYGVLGAAAQAGDDRCDQQDDEPG